MEELFSTHEEALLQETTKVAELEDEIRNFKETTKEIEITDMFRKSVELDLKYWQDMLKLLEDENKVLICENETLKESLIIAESEIKELQLFRDDCRSTHPALAEVNESLKIKVAEIEENVTKYNAMLEDRIVGYKISIEESDEKNFALTSELAEFKKLCEILEDKVIIIEDSEEKNFALNRELAEFKKLCEILEDKVIMFENDQNSETVKIAQINSDLMSKIENLEQELCFAAEIKEKMVFDHKEEKLDFEKSLLETQENCSEIASMQAANVFLEEKLSDLEKELGTISEVIVGVKARNHELESRNEQLEGILEEHENGLRISVGKIELQELEKTELSLKIEKMKRKLETQEITAQNSLAKENQELKVAMEANLGQIEAISSAQKGLISENGGLKLNLKEMNGKLAEYIKLCEDTETLKIQNTDLKCAIDKLDTTNKELTTENSKFNNKISAKNDQADKFQTEILNLQSDLEKIAKSLDTEWQKSAGLEDQNEKLRTDFDTQRIFQQELLTTERSKSTALSNQNSQLTSDLHDQRIFQEVFTKES